MSGGFRKEKHIFSQVALRHLFTFLRPVEITQMKTTSSLRVVVTQRKKNSLAPAGKAINAYGWNVTSFSVDTEPHVPFRICTTRKNICTHFKAGLGEQCASMVLFITIVCFRELNRFLEISVRGPRKILRVSRNSILETRFSILENRNSILNSRKLQGSRIKFRVETVNLPLSGTVYKLKKN